MKTILRVTILALLGGLGGALLGAQDAAPSAKPAAAKDSMPMPMTKPTPEMAKMIKLMAGNWTVTEKHDPSPMMPKGGSGKGTAVMTPGPGGTSLMEKYQSTGAMGPNFNGFGTFWWDPKQQLFRTVWCDNMTPNGCDTSGTTKWEGDKLVGMMESEMNGQKMFTRFVYSDFKPGSFIMTMEVGTDPNNMKKASVITYTKVPRAKKM